MAQLKKILLIDDDPVTHFIIKRMVAFLQLPWELRTYQHPAKLLWELGETDWRPDLAIVDQHLPDITGPELMELLRQQGHDFAWVWLSSGLARPNLAGNLSPEAFFNKPIVPDTLRMCDTLARLALLQKSTSQS
jgi:CheY-like chemotaxis protein